MLSFSIALGYLLDNIFGDPQWFPHPVRMIGFFIRRLEVILRRLVKNEKTAGLCLVVLIVIPTYALILWLCNRASKVNLFYAVMLQAFFIYTALALKDLKVHGHKVYEALKEKNVVAARKRLSLMVGRDTDNLSQAEIVRASVETVAENSVDGVISPLFYALLGGAPLALCYKAVNTLDSMIGYKNEKYERFGWTAARLDDIANFIPARIAVFFLALSSWLCAKDARQALAIGIRDGRKNPSPNSGIPEAVIAGALGVQLGGLNFYQSVACQKPIIGDGRYSLEPKHIEESMRIVSVASGLFMIVCVGVLWVFKR